MYIECTNPATRRLYDASLTDEDGDPVMSDPVEFASTGTAQVSKEVGERLVEEYDDIQPHDGG
jgi:hypothetical protein